jgi:hypothetical protein
MSFTMIFLINILIFIFIPFIGFICRKAIRPRAPGRGRRVSGFASFAVNLSFVYAIGALEIAVIENNPFETKQLFQLLFPLAVCERILDAQPDGEINTQSKTNQRYRQSGCCRYWATTCRD